MSVIMNIAKAHLICFSPTRTSRSVGEAILRGTGAQDIAVTDLTHGEVAFPEMNENELAVVAVPVYGGHIPRLAVSRMAALRANGTPAVAVAVYGNRAYEKALQELDALLSEKGFRVTAAATFIGEHSYSTESLPIAAGRPDKNDLEEAASFGSRIRTKLDAAAGASDLRPVDVRRIGKPRQRLIPLLRFVMKVIRLRKSGTPMPASPTADAGLCTRCGHCVAVCPNGAIIKGDECNTLTDRCIRCCACVKGCPRQVRRFDTPFAALLADCFKERKDNKVII